MDVPTAETFRLIYRSHDRIPAEQRRAGLGELFTQARSDNKRREITGALLLEDDWFVQALEGDERVVRELFARIEVDPRHDDVEILESGRVKQRVFARWAMARVSRDDGPDLALIAHADGISPAADRGDATARQERVLARMRAAAGG